jgi:hypothetical protein
MVEGTCREVVQVGPRQVSSAGGSRILGYKGLVEVETPLLGSPEVNQSVLVKKTSQS